MTIFFLAISFCVGIFHLFLLEDNGYAPSRTPQRNPDVSRSFYVRHAPAPSESARSGNWGGFLLRTAFSYPPERMSK